MSVQKWFAKLETELAAHQQWLDSDSLFRIFGFGNALFEGLLDRFAPGSSQTIKGHDHAGYSNQGGRALARGTAYSAGAGNDGLFQCSISVSNTWTVADDDDNSALQRSGNTLAMFKVYVSEGFTTGGSGPYLWGWVNVGFDVNGNNKTEDHQCRIYNATTASYSSEVTVQQTSTDFDQVRFSLVDIPMQPGWNDLKLELTCNLNHVASITYCTTYVCFSEAADSSGASVSSSGSQVL